MVTFHPQGMIPIDITGSDSGIVDTRRRVLQQGQNGPSAVRDQWVADSGCHSIQPWSNMLHRQKLSKRVGMEGPHVADLCSIRIDDLEMLSLVQANCSAMTSWDEIRV